MASRFVPNLANAIMKVVIKMKFKAIAMIYSGEYNCTSDSEKLSII